MSRGSRHGQASYDTMTAPSTMGRLSHGPDKGNIGFQKRVPAWYVCDAREFEQVWLPKFESGQLPRPTEAEMRKYDSLLLRAETAEEAEDLD
jgi:hypothetical protein